MNKIVIFYEKPGCATNTKQKQILRASGCMVIERNLLEHGLSSEELYAFFEGMPVSEWFNPNAPAVKSGQVDPMAVNEKQALQALMMEPILIKRPLMLIAGARLCGFDQKRVESLLGSTLSAPVSTECSGSDEHCAPVTPQFTLRSSR